jgi:hypothetical protein
MKPQIPPTLSLDTLFHSHRCNVGYLIADEVYGSAAAVNNHEAVATLGMDVC